MKHLFTLVFAVFIGFFCTAQELQLNKIKAKDAPHEAVVYLKSQNLKAKKAKWFYAQPGIYFADFRKKKISKVSYYFLANGQLLYKRLPITENELPKELRSMLGERIKASAAQLHVYKGNAGSIYSISMPTGESTSVTKYFTSDGSISELKFK